MTAPALLEIPLVELTTPHQGYTVVANRWWATRNGNPVPCCHPDRDLLLEWAKARGMDVMFIPVAFWPGKPPL